MKKVLLYLLLVLLTISCKKDEVDVYATEYSSQGIVGKWRLVEIASSDGANTSRIDMEPKNYIITFESDGDVLSPDYPCAGKYVFDSTKQGLLGDRNLAVTFLECEASKVEWYSLRGQADARIIDSNTLYLNFENCDEACTRTYRRLKR